MASQARTHIAARKTSTVKVKVYRETSTSDS